MTELTLPCAFVRKRGLPDSRFLCITYAATYTRARTHIHTRTRTSSRIFARFPPFPPSTYCRAHRAVRFPPSWPPRGPSLSTSAIQPWEQLHAPFGAVPFPRSFLPSCSCIRLLRIQLIRKTVSPFEEKKFGRFLCTLDRHSVIPHWIKYDDFDKPEMPRASFLLTVRNESALNNHKCVSCAHFS